MDHLTLTSMRGRCPAGAPRAPRGSDRAGDGDEEPGAGGGDRRRRGRRRDAVPSHQEGLVGRRAARAQGADLGLDLARRRPTTAVQHELLGRPDPQVLGRALQAPGDGDRQDVGLRQCSNIRLALNRDRMDEYHQYGRRRDHRRQGRVPDAPSGQGDLAALQHRGRGRRDPPSRGWLHPAGRRHPGDGPGRAPAAPRSTARPRGRDRAEAVGRMAGQDRPGRDRVRARGFGHRQLLRAGPAPWSGSTSR